MNESVCVSDRPDLHDGYEIRFAFGGETWFATRTEAEAAMGEYADLISGLTHESQRKVIAEQEQDRG